MAKSYKTVLDNLYTEWYIERSKVEEFSDHLRQIVGSLRGAHQMPSRIDNPTKQDDVTLNRRCNAIYAQHRMIDRRMSVRVRCAMPNYPASFGP